MYIYNIQSQDIKGINCSHISIMMCTVQAEQCNKMHEARIHHVALKRPFKIHYQQ